MGTQETSSGYENSTVPQGSLSNPINEENRPTIDLEACEQFIAFPFDSDRVFQEGIASILRSTELSSQPAEEQERIIGRAKAFYFTKQTGIPMTWDEFAEYRFISDANITPTQGVPLAANKESPAPLSFKEISELIQTGQTHLIPHNEEIPGGLNDASPSESRVPTRKKPWETATVEIDPAEST